MERAGAWSLPLADAAELDNPPLSVIVHDVDCVLTMTSLRTASGLLLAMPAIDLSETYKTSASTFGDPILIYANSKLSAVNFGSDFVLTVLYSDDPALASGSNGAGFDLVMGTATADKVAAPDYTLDLTGITVLTDVANIVQSANGEAVLTAGLVPGQKYVVTGAVDLFTHAELDSAFVAGIGADLTATIPAAAFTLVGEDLTTPQVRTLILANTSNGVNSYQAFQITFLPAIWN